jgi:acyl-coenzyme A synthetase/AMP-(fatty) acid ligase
MAFRTAAELPRTATGKIHKPGLRQELARCARDAGVTDRVIFFNLATFRQ